MEHTGEAEMRRQPLPRDISRFKKLYPNGRAVIKSDPTKTFAFLSTIELINEDLKSLAGEK